MKPYLAILASALALTASAETVQQLRIINLSGGNDGLAWIDKQGNAHKFDSTNTVSILYASNIVGIINYSNLPAISPTNWSTFDAVSDVHMAGQAIANASGITANSINTTLGAMFNGDTITSSGSFSTFSLAEDTTFGFHNGEPAGVGSDVNIISDNGNVLISPRLGIGTPTPSTDIDIVSQDPSHSPFISMTYAQGGIGDVSCGLLFFNENGLNGAFTATADGFSPVGSIVANQCIFQSRLVGGLLLTTYGGGPMIFAGSSATELARFDASTGAFLIGSTTDNGTGSLLQVTGGISFDDGTLNNTTVGGTVSFNGDYTLASGDVVHVNRGFVMGFN